jgi:hyperosmotically inducible periplasmic protein
MRTIVRLLLVIVLLVAGAFLVLGYWAGSSWNDDGAVGTSGIDTDRAREAGADATERAREAGADATERAREAGAEVGERVAVAGQRLKEEAAEATLTGKIKAKMALDDAIKARAIDVTTEGSVVTLSGTVETAAERDRALRLTRETEGVSRVVDRLATRQR